MNKLVAWSLCIATGCTVVSAPASKSAEPQAIAGSSTQPVDAQAGAGASAAGSGGVTSAGSGGSEPAGRAAAGAGGQSSGGGGAGAGAGAGGAGASGGAGSSGTSGGAGSDGRSACLAKTPGCRFEWSLHIGAGYDEQTRGMAVDTGGGLSILAFANGNVDMASGTEVLVYQFDAAGRQTWLRNPGGAENDTPDDIAVDSRGNVFVTARIAGMGSVLIKYDVHGTMLWSKSFGERESLEPRGVAADSQGNAIVIGAAIGPMDGIERGDIYVAKYDANGANVWTRQLQTPTLDFASGVAANAAGDVYIAGGTAGAFQGNTSGGGGDAILIKYSAAGALVWSRQFGTSSEEYAVSVSVGREGEVVLAGVTKGALHDNVNVGNEDVFVTKYDPSGQRQWTRQLGTLAGDIATDISFDSGRIYVTAQTMGEFEGFRNAGANDAALIALGPTGETEWVQQFGTFQGDFPTAVAVGQTGGVFVAGNTAGSLDLHMNAGAGDIFLVQYDGLGQRVATFCRCLQ